MRSNETLTGSGQTDYSEIYRTQEMKQLQKRLRRTRNTLFICSAAVLAGGTLFWVMPEIGFTFKELLFYVLIAGVLAVMGFFSSKKPYSFLLFALVLCMALWGIEIIWGKADEILIEGSIHKLFIISLLVSGLHTSREAELIKKELHFS